MTQSTVHNTASDYTVNVLQTIWAHELGVDRIDADEDFFDLGGYSLLAIRITAEVNEAFGIELPLPVLFRNPTLTRYAAVVDRAVRERHGPLVIHQVFEEQALRRPEAVALAGGGTLITYAEASRCANRLAHRLIGHGVGPEQRVAILLAPSTDYVLAVLAVLKAGGCYVPLDTTYPRAHLAAILADTEAEVVVTTGELAPLVAGCPVRTVCVEDPSPGGEESDPGVPTSPDNLAYVVYTSGSTGRPKGVMVRHGSVVRLVRDPMWVRLGPGAVIPQLTSICFDVSMFEIWGALLNGGRLVVEPGATGSLRSLRRVVAEHGVTTMWLTAGLFHAVVDEDVDSLSGVEQLLAGGEAPSAKHVRKLLHAHPGMRFINGYGPTEATIFATTHTVSPDDETGASIPIGDAVPGARLRILDDRLHQVPDGTPGQLFIGGTALARGYLGRPALTAERFMPDPHGDVPGGRLYATGDLVLRKRDGSIEYLGRIDRQVKVRGFRVELGEVEAAARQHPAVRDIVVTAHGDAPENRLLVAYPVLDPAQDPAEALTAVRAWLPERLPKHLVPDVWLPLPKLPLTASGKVDRRALPDPLQGGSVTRTEGRRAGAAGTDPERNP